MKCRVGMCVMVLFGVMLAGCRSRPKVQEVVAGDRDSVAVLRAIQALVEDVDRQVNVRWWGSMGPLRQTSGDTDSAMDVTLKHCGGLSLHIRERKRMQADDRQEIKVRSEYDHSKVVHAPSSPPRWWVWCMGFILAALLMWVGLRAVRRMGHAIGML